VTIDDRQGQWLTVSQAARLLGVSAQTVRKWTDAGALPTARTQGRHRRYNRALIEQLVAGGKPVGGGGGAGGGGTELAGELADIVLALVDEQDPRAVLDTACRKLMDTVHCSAAAITAYDAAVDSVVALAERGNSLPIDEAWYALADFPITAAVIRERRIVLVDRSDPHADEAEVKLLNEYGDQTLLMAPLVFRGDVVGIVELTDDKPGRRYTDAELSEVERLCAEVALEVQIARALEGLHRQKAAAERSGAEFELLMRTAQAMGSSLELHETLMTVTRSITDTLGVAWSDFYQWFPDEQIIEVAAYYQIPEVPIWEDWVGTRLGAENMRDWSVTIEQHKPSLAYRDDPDITAAERELMDEYGEKATLTVPIVYQGEVLGMLDVGESRWNRRYTEDEVRLLTTIASQAASAINNARQFEESRQRATELATLLEVSESLSSSSSVDGMLNILCEKLRIALDVFSAEAYEYDEEAGAIRMLANNELEPIDLGDWDGSYLVSDVPMIGRAINEMQPVVTQVDDADLPEVSRQDMLRWGEYSSLSVPMVHGGGVVGLVYLAETRERHTFDARDMRLATAIAAQGAVAVENARAYAQIARQAITDGLTGLYNHGHLQERLEQEVARTKRQGLNLSVIMLDIDDFKKFNDTYGHPQGDTLLREIAKVLQESTRLKVDLVARYGGEEFCILLPNTPPQILSGDEPSDDSAETRRSAEVVAERIRAAVAAQRFEGYPSRREALVTMSVGVAALPASADTGDDLVANADKALYLAKREGKNQVCLYEA
jgi:diguanylate cyclase (GGDEF)-like protein/excisionase family DNA binding protein